MAVGPAAGPAQSSPAARSPSALWRGVRAEFGLLSGEAVDALLGPESPAAGCLAADRRILGIATRAGRVLYPGFQFGTTPPAVLPIIEAVARRGIVHGCRDRLILTWFCLPNASLEGKRPVDLMGAMERLLCLCERDFRWDARRSQLN